MASVSLHNLTKQFPGTGGLAVDSVDLNIEHGEFMVLLGPSGCGKSTTLRMIAGLESISDGEVRIGEKPVNDVPARDRDIAMVFQSYALYPHMSIFDNLAFGLRRRKIAHADINSRVRSVATTLGLAEFLERKPAALSGGQRQRVALGRAIVRDPQVFLFDEPLSNLDASLRLEMRTELIRLHQRLAATMIYVTHDQVEAMTMGDRLCIMNQGKVVQSGKPLDVYREPQDTFVARFLGSPAMNLIPGHFGNQDTLTVGEIDLPQPQRSAPMDVLLGIRPENISIDGSTPHCRGQATTVERLGAETILALQLAGVAAELMVRIPKTLQIEVGDSVPISFDMTAAHLFDPVSRLRIS